MESPISGKCSLERDLEFVSPTVSVCIAVILNTYVIAVATTKDCTASGIAALFLSLSQHAFQQRDIVRLLSVKTKCRRLS
jgi:hypothetical protein